MPLPPQRAPEADLTIGRGDRWGSEEDCVHYQRAPFGVLPWAAGRSLGPGPDR